MTEFTLQAFLQTTELDDLAHIANQLDPTTSEIQSSIVQVIHQWQPTQAIANLLMYPMLLPAELRRDALFKGLQAPERSYLTLAAIVGLQRYISELSEADQGLITKQLFEIMLQSRPPISAQASVLLFDCCQAEDADGIISLINHPSDMVKHNVLVTLIETIGLSQLEQLIAAGITDYRVLADGKTYADAQLSLAKTYFHDGNLDQEQWLLSDFSAPLLPRIPNLVEYLAAFGER
jgi:hypothetical protein